MKRTALKRKTPLRKRSRKRSVKHEEYMRLREAYLAEHDLCELWLAQRGYDRDNFGHRIMAFAEGCPKATEVHHRCCGKNRKATLLRVDTWMAVSAQGHDFIHANPAIAYERGWLLKTIPDANSQDS